MNHENKHVPAEDTLQLHSSTTQQITERRHHRNVLAHVSDALLLVGLLSCFGGCADIGAHKIQEGLNPQAITSDRNDIDTALLTGGIGTFLAGTVVYIVDKTRSKQSSTPLEDNSNKK